MPDQARLALYGTTTRASDAWLLPGAHYLGVRFRPGQSRHFVEAGAASLVDACVAADRLTWLDGERLARAFACGSAFAWLDIVLLRHIEHHPPYARGQDAALDAAIRHIGMCRGDVRIAALAQAFGFSRRQFERRVRDCVGVPPKVYASIARFQSAAARIAHSPSLAGVAADCGYVDQSHMNRAFARYAGLSPARARHDDAFVQDASLQPGDAERPIIDF